MRLLAESIRSEGRVGIRIYCCARELRGKVCCSDEEKESGN